MEKCLQNSEMKLFPSTDTIAHHCQSIVMAEERQKSK